MLKAGGRWRFRFAAVGAWVGGALGLCGNRQTLLAQPLPAEAPRFAKAELMAVATDGYRLSVVREEITDLNTGMGGVAVHRAGGGDD